jgi:bifunctional non-homologous end joining protein LigD
MSKPVKASVAGHELTLSNLEKVFYPATGFTKGQVIDYYLRVAPVLMPHLRGRPLNLKRYPNGVDEQFFFQKECPAPRPGGVTTSAFYSETNKADVNYCVIEDEAGLVWIANLASIELHTYLALAQAWNRPTQIVFDLDPGEPAGVLESAAMALRLRDLLAELKLQCFAKTSGGKGMHLAVPLNTPVTYEETKPFAHALATRLAEADPEHATANMRKDLRVGKILVDWSQNVEGKSTVCVYSLRARERPTVSTPVSWEEVEAAVKRKNAAKLSFEADEVLKRVEKLGDLFAPVLKLKQKLPKL